VESSTSGVTGQQQQQSNSLANETVVAIELNETLQIAKYKNKDVGSEISTIDGIELFVYKLSINSTVTVRNKQTHTIIANVHIASMEMAKHALKLGYRIYASEVKATIRTAEQAGGMDGRIHWNNGRIQ
jgi:hypothetical protein